jgi:hypothetical protein
MLILIPMIAGSVLFIVLSTHHQLILGEPVGNRPLPDWGLILANVFILLVGVLVPVAVMTFKLRVAVSPDRLTVDYGILARNQAPVSDIERAEAVDYRPIRDYGGWGLRSSFRSGRRAYTVSGSRGVEVDLVDGRRWLIGSQRPVELVRAIDRAREP